MSHAGAVLLAELAADTGLVGAVTRALADTYRGVWLHAPGQVFGDLAVAVADGAKTVTGIEVLRDRRVLFGQVASMPTAWRLLERIDPGHLRLVSEARRIAREAAWAAGAGPDLTSELIIDADATILVAHSDKENVAATWKHTWGFHPLLTFLDRPEVAGGEALAGLLRPGNAGSNTAADHIELLRLTLEALPAMARPRPGDPDGPRVLMRTDSAGASKKFAAALRQAGVRFSLGFTVDERVNAAVESLLEPDAGGRRKSRRWKAAVNTDGSTRSDTWVADITNLVELDQWPTGSRLIARLEPLHPGAQTTLCNTTNCGRYRITCFLTDTPAHGRHRLDGGVPALDLRHRQHARVEDRIRQGKDTGLRNLPCYAFDHNAAWLQIVLTAIDLITWTKLLAFNANPDQSDLATCEIDTFRYRVLHVAGQLVNKARRIHLRLDRDWRWTPALTTAFTRQRAAFGHT